MQENFILEMMAACDQVEAEQREIEELEEQIKYLRLEREFWSEVDYEDVTTKWQNETRIQYL